MALRDQFDFYMTLAKPLALSLTKTDCRAGACAWLKVLQDCEDSQLRVDYLKLLIFVMQKNNLVWPFSEVPPADATLQPFPDNLSLSKMLVRVSEKACGDAGAGDSKPRVSEFVSPDLKQFVALQTLPGDQGIQCYMAIGTDEMNKWEQTTSSSCSCNNMSERLQPPAMTDPLHPQDPFGHAFPPRYSPMIRYQRQRRRMDQMPARDPAYQSLCVEPKWIPTKEEVYWLKKMNKMIRRPGGPDTIFMDDVKRYYGQADRSQTTDDDWDPYQAQQEEAAAEYSPAVPMPPPGVDQQFPGPQDEFVDESSEGISMDNIGQQYQQAPMPVSPQAAAAAGRWMKPVYQDPNIGYESDAVPYASPPRPTMQAALSPAPYNNSPSYEDSLNSPRGRRNAPPYQEDSLNTPKGRRNAYPFVADSLDTSSGLSTRSPGRPKWAKRHVDLDFSDQSEKFYSLRTENLPKPNVQYGAASPPNLNLNDAGYPQSPQPPPGYKYGYPQQRSPPYRGGGPAGMYSRRPPSPVSDLEEEPSRIVVFHCQCTCKK